MKTVSGQVVSTKTISVSKAAKALSNFVAAETGASRPVSAYLRRASAEFIDLVQFHRELKASMYDRKLKKHAQESNLVTEEKERKKRKSREVDEVEAVESTEQSNLKKKKKKKAKRRKIEGQD